METTLYKITFKDGRIFKVFCANRSQKNRFIKSTIYLNKEDVIEQNNGIHNIKQWEQIIKTIN